MALLNISGAGYFSSDRTIAEYNEDIWHLGETEEVSGIEEEAVRARNGHLGQDETDQKNI